MAARKRPTKKKAGRKSSERAPGPGERARSALARLEAELPPNLRDFSRQVQRGLSRLEKQIESAQRDARRRWARLLRDVSHQLGGLEGRGEQRWRQQSLQARREAVRLLQRLQKAIEPPRGPARSAAAKP